MNVISTADARLQRMEQAAQWLQRIHTAADDEQVLEAWLDWCQRDPLNQQAFDELAAVWELTDNLDAGDATAGNAGGSIAASNDPDALRTLLSRRAVLAASLGTALSAGVAGLWWFNRAGSPEAAGITFSSPTGVNTVERLPDGSVLELGGGTHVTVRMDPRRRRVQLHEGELYVVVQKDAQRPFSVQAGRLEAVATGTAFNVLRTDNCTTVTVAEGSVETRFDQKAATMPRHRLQPEQQLIYSHDSHSVDVRTVNPELISAWRKGKLTYKNEPLAEVIAAVNRYAASPILIGDAQVGSLRYSGTVSVDNIQGWLGALQHSFRVAVVQLPDGRQRIDVRPGTAAD